MWDQMCIAVMLELKKRDQGKSHGGCTLTPSKPNWVRACLGNWLSRPETGAWRSRTFSPYSSSGYPLERFIICSYVYYRVNFSSPGEKNTWWDLQRCVYPMNSAWSRTVLYVKMICSCILPQDDILPQNNLCSLIVPRDDLCKIFSTSRWFVWPYSALR